MPSPKFYAYLALVLACLFAGACRAQVKAESAEEAADRYHELCLSSNCSPDTTAELAKQVPVDQRASFVAGVQALPSTRSQSNELAHG